MDQEKKANGAPSATAYAELRRLLLPERDDLSRLRDRLSDPQLRSEDVAEVLPQALHTGAARGPELRAALRPLVEEAIRTSVLKDPALLADALFPMIGAALRKAAASASRGAMQTLHQVVERTLSWRSLRWRWESLTTGKSFGEIVLARSLLYRVEQVFLIDRGTGLLLRQCAADDDIRMLPAIQDFVRDSSGGPPDRELETFRAGEFVVCIQYLKQAVLAVVIRGTPPKQLKGVFARVLEDIYVKHGQEIENFQGDSSPFLSCQEDLSACLLGQAPEEPRRLSPLWWLAAAILLEGIGYWIFTGARDRQRWDTYMARLHSQPGIVVTSVETHRSSYLVSGLRDPLAVEPATLISGTGVDPAKVAFHWELYHSLQPFFEGSRRLANEKQVIENQTLHFGPVTTELSEEDLATVNQLAAHIRALLATAKDMHRRAGIEVVGHADSTALEEDNPQLAQTRADTTRGALIDAGVPDGAILARGVGASEPLRRGDSPTDQLFNRYVSFRIILH